MRTSDAPWTLAIAIAVALPVAMNGCTATQSPPPPPPMVNEVEIGAALDSLTTAFVGAVTARETTLVANFYSDDAHFLPANAARADGKDAVRQVWAGFLATPGLQMSLTPNTKLVSDDGDLVVDLGAYVMNWQDAKGKTMTDKGKYVTVYKKVNGEWKIVVDTFNSDAPPPGV
jgi:uncharacterized protein (TIGR02246 family)